MAYCTVEEVLGAIKESAYDALLGDEYIEDLEERRRRLVPYVEEAVADADAEIDGYLAKRYDVPMSPAPRVLNKFSKDIAVYNLMSRIGIDEQDRDKTYLNRYQSAISFWKGLRKELSISEPEAAGIHRSRLREGASGSKARSVCFQEIR